MNDNYNREEHLAYLADILLKQGEIVSDEQPYSMTLKSCVEFVLDIIPEEIPIEAFFYCWKDDEGEADIDALEKMLEFNKEAARKFIDVTVQDHESSLDKWSAAN